MAKGNGKSIPPAPPTTYGPHQQLDGGKSPQPGQPGYPPKQGPPPPKVAQGHPVVMAPPPQPGQPAHYPPAQPGACPAPGQPAYYPPAQPGTYPAPGQPCPYPGYPPQPPLVYVQGAQRPAGYHEGTCTCGGDLGKAHWTVMAWVLCFCCCPFNFCYPYCMPMARHCKNCGKTYYKH